ncbi:hypothetical protein ACFIQF_20565 [Comamonas sp. J-3]
MQQMEAFGSYPSLACVSDCGRKASSSIATGASHVRRTQIHARNFSFGFAFGFGFTRLFGIGRKRDCACSDISHQRVGAG